MNKKENSKMMKNIRSRKRTATKEIPEISETIEITKSMKELILFLKQENISHNRNPNYHSVNICVVYDRFITGIMDVCWV